MTNQEAVNWIINITADIGKSEYRALWHYEQALSEIRELLEDGVQPQRMRGKWMQCDMDKWKHGALICSKCSKGYHLPHEVSLFDWNFCPNCGADMRGTE